MTMQESIKYTDCVIESAKEWINGNATISNQEELCIIACHYNVRLPKYVYNFNYSENPNHVCATGAHKLLLKLLDRLKIAIVGN